MAPEIASGTTVCDRLPVLWEVGGVPVVATFAVWFVLAAFEARGVFLSVPSFSLVSHTIQWYDVVACNLDR